jgi:amino acid adenylation domain-containing protein
MNIDHNSIKTILDLIEFHAQKNPNHIALIDGESNYTYQQIRYKSNQLANYLKASIDNKKMVGLCCERGINTTLGILSIFKSQACYAPLDPDLPSLRLESIISKTGIEYLLCDEENAPRFKHLKVKTIIINWDEACLVNSSGELNGSIDDAGKLAYVMFTSGTSGEVKGVKITHATLLERYCYSPYYNYLNEKSRLAAITALSWNPSIYENIYTLASGATIVCFKTLEIKNPIQLASLLVKYEINFIRAVPSLLEALVDVKWDGSENLTIVTHGEKLSFKLYEKLKNISQAVYNTYGSTEATLFSLMSFSEEFKRVIQLNSELKKNIKILNEIGLEVEVGQVGEICFSGAVIAEGYLNDPELTSQKFPTINNERIYKTGDLAKFISNDQLEFLGRSDNQVKIRGQRIELEEIESILITHPEVNDCAVVVVKNNTDSPLIVAFVVSKAIHTQTQLELFCQARMSSAMLPSQFYFIDHIPLTSNGKIDRKKLTGQALDLFYQRNYSAPINDTEKKIANIFSLVLKINLVGRDDHFFRLGGNSLSAAITCSRILEHFFVEVDLKCFYENPTVKSLASVIDQKLEMGLTTHLEPITKMEVTTNAEASYAQERLFFLHQLSNKNDIQYHLPFALRLRGELNVNALTTALNKIFDRHEILKTSLELQTSSGKNNLTQTINFHQKLNFEIIHVEVNSAVKPGEQVATLISDDNNKPFNLIEGQVFRARLFKITNDDHVLYLNVHHIASDGWSMAILRSELALAYNAYHSNREPDLSDLKYRYLDYASWHRKLLSSSKLNRELDFWKKELLGLEDLTLPFNKKSGGKTKNQGSKICFNLNTQQTSQINQYCTEEALSLYIYLLSIFKLLLYKYTHVDDIALATALAGRRRSDFEGIIGFFVNTLVIRNEINENESFQTFCRKVNDKYQTIYNYQDVPFEQIVKAINPKRDMLTNPLVQVAFVLQNTPFVTSAWNDLEIEVFSLACDYHRFDLELHARERDGVVNFELIYNNELFEAWEIQQLADHYVALVNQTLIDRSSKIKDISVLTGEQKDYLLNHLNTTHYSYPEETIQSLIEKNAQNLPDHLAVHDEKKQLNYLELNQKANQLARYLLEQGVESNKRVGICLERSVDLVISMLAVKKTGAVFVPVDPSNPIDRINLIFKQAEAVFIIDDNFFKTITDERLSSYSSVNLAISSSIDDEMYIIFTSGSTGEPNGVSLTQRGVINLVNHFKEKYNFSKNDRASYLSSPSFDASIFEIWVNLANQVSLFIPNNQIKLDLTQLVDWIDNHEITLCFLPTAYMEQLYPIKLPERIRYIFTGGDRLVNYPPIGFPPLINMYGPTENTVITTEGSVAKDTKTTSKLPNIGRPIINNRIYVVDKNLSLVPFGAIGEMAIASDGLARCYINNTSLTEVKFKQNILNEKRIYLTGDLVRYDKFANIDYIGRADKQIKVRGHRIELNEINSLLLSQKSIAEAYSLVKNDSIYAFITLNLLGVSSELKAEIIKDCIERWESLYDNEYEYCEFGEFNIIGWNSSFDLKPIAKSAMQEWVDNTLARLALLKPKKVYEIGCGSGLLTSGLVKNVERYVGIDLSSKTIGFLKQNYDKNNESYQQVDFYAQPAHHLDKVVSGEYFDLVVLNSIIQYFPDISYLTEVLNSSITRIKTSGHLFVGDIRNYDLIYEFHLAVALFQNTLNDKVDVHSFLQKMVNNDKELLVAPSYFYHLKEEVTAISSVSIMPKRGAHLTEMNMFRYDVVISINREIKIIKPDTVIENCPNNLAKLEAMMGESNWRYLLIKNVFDSRNVSYIKRLRVEVISSQSCVDVSLEDFYQLANKHGLKVKTKLNYDSITYQVLFYRSDENEMDIDWEITDLNITANESDFANIPLLYEIRSKLKHDFNRFLACKLPSYMLPADILVLDKMPLTINEKIDEKSLKQLIDLRNDNFIQAPLNETEAQLVSLFKDVLGVKHIGLKDNFFKLGGHSLLAVKLLAQLGKLFNVNISLKQFFETPSIETIAKIITTDTSSELHFSEDKQKLEKLPLTVADLNFYFGQRFIDAPINSWFQMMELQVTDLDESKLTKAIGKIYDLHPITRAQLSQIDGYSSDLHWMILPINTSDMLITYNAISESDVIKLIDQHLRTPHSIGEAPLCRFVLVKNEAGPDRLLITYYHSAIDGAGIQCLVNSLMANYLELSDPCSRYTPLTNDEMLSLHVQELNQTDERKLTLKLSFNNLIMRLLVNLKRKVNLELKPNINEFIYSHSDSIQILKRARELDTSTDRMFIVAILKAALESNILESKKMGYIDTCWAINLRPPAYYTSIVANHFAWATVRLNDHDSFDSWKSNILNLKNDVLIGPALSWFKRAKIFYQSNTPKLILILKKILPPKYSKFLTQVLSVNMPSLFISNTSSLGLNDITQSELATQFGLKKLIHYSPASANNRPIIIISQIDQKFKIKITSPVNSMNEQEIQLFLDNCYHNLMSI